MIIYWQKNIHHRGVFWTLCDDHLSVLKELKSGLWKRNSTEGRCGVWRKVKKGKVA